MKDDMVKNVQEVARKAIEVFQETMDKAGEFIETKKEPLRIRWDITSKQAELEEMFTEYGKKVYFSSDGIDELTYAISDKLREIKELEDTLSELTEENTCGEDVVFCTRCGKEHDAGENFCSKCGAQLKK